MFCHIEEVKAISNGLLLSVMKKTGDEEYSVHSTVELKQKFEQNKARSASGLNYPYSDASAASGWNIMQLFR
jgi:hypothetical protein